MPSDARARLAKAIAEHGDAGRLILFKDPLDPGGFSAEGADLAPHSALTVPTDGRPSLTDRLREVNARSRGGLL